MVAKAYLMAYLVSGKRQITIANYQRNKKGEDELVITDLNPVIQETGVQPLISNKLAGSGASVKMLEVSRQKRKERFQRVREMVEDRRKKK